MRIKDLLSQDIYKSLHEEIHYKDLRLTCKHCKRTFVFKAEEQMNWKYDNFPKSCHVCRKKRRHSPL